MLKKIVSICILSLGLLACTTAEPKPVNQLAGYPKWVSNAESKSEYIAATGSVKLGPAGIPVGRKIALTNARVELGKIMKTKMASITKNYTEAIGVGEEQEANSNFSQTSNAFSNEVLSGSKQLDMFISPQNDLYVLIGISKKEIEEKYKKKMMELTGKLKEEKKISVKITSKKAQEELQQAIEKDDMTKEIQSREI